MLSIKKTDVSSTTGCVKYTWKDEDQICATYNRAKPV